MKCLRLGCLACLTAVSAAAGTIVDVTAQVSQQMNPGDTLYFQISNLSLQNVTGVQFQFVSAPLDSTLDFTAELTSRDGATRIPFPALAIGSGSLAASGYQGRISSISGALPLPPGLSSAVFRNTRATLVLHDVTSTATFGLPGYTLPQDMLVSLGSGTSSAGAFVAAVQYEDPPPTPECGSVVLMAFGLLVLAALSHVSSRSLR